MLSIVIVSYNSRDLLDQCLASVETHCSEAEVVIVDNDSHDGSAAMVREKYPLTKLVSSTENLGVAGAYNLGIRETTRDFILLLKSHTVLEDDSLARCVIHMQENPRLGAISPRLIGVHDQPQAAVHAFPSWRTRVRRAFSDGQDTFEPRPGEEGWLSGTALLLRRHALVQIGGYLDPDYGMFWEDADASAKLLSAGWMIAEYQDARVRHCGEASGEEPDPVRRPELFAHYAWGEHCWFLKHRSNWESAVIWWLDVLYVLRKAICGTLRPSCRTELRRAQVLAQVLRHRLMGQPPQMPT